MKILLKILGILIIISVLTMIVCVYVFIWQYVQHPMAGVIMTAIITLLLSAAIMKIIKDANH